MNPSSEEKATTSSTSDAGAAPVPPPARDEAGEAVPAADAIDEQLQAAKAEAAAAHDRYLRAMADLENYRRRSMREREEIRTGAAARVLQDILPIWDNLGLGLAAARQPNADLKTLVGGMDLVLQQLKAALAAHGLAEFSPVGVPFDPHQHEAISHQPSPTVAAEHVVSVVRSGFNLNGRLLRPASVVVSSGPDAEKAR
ncbi:MAG: nucleotide exchange factor GrpE [Opitutaceae bacterium]